MKSILSVAAAMLLYLFSSAQNVGIGTTSPLALLHGEGGHLFFYSAGFVPSDPVGFTPPALGRILLWQSNKGALRNGFAFPEDLDESLMGNFSFSSGERNQSYGQWSATIGYGNKAMESGSFALGYLSQANGAFSIAAGNGAQAIGESAVATGEASIAAGDISLALGYGNVAYGRGSAAVGYGNKAWAYGSFAAGLYNDTTRVGNSFIADAGNRIFQIGNGTSDLSRSNALTILQNGNTGIGVLVPAEKLEVAGNGKYSGNISVQGDKGIIRNSSNEQLKKQTTVINISTAFAAGETKTFIITWPESFSGATEAWVGNITDGSSAGWDKMVMTLASVTNTGAVLYVHNTSSISEDPDYGVKIVAIGGQ